MIIYETALAKPIAAMGAPVSLTIQPGSSDLRKFSARRKFLIAAGAVSVAAGLMALRGL